MKTTTTHKPIRDLRTDETASTTLEWALLLAAIAIPGYFVIRLALMSIVGHYQMMTAINSLPIP